jgi:hypothetical protein
MVIEVWTTAAAYVHRLKVCMNTFRHAAVMPEINTKINQSIYTLCRQCIILRQIKQQVVVTVCIVSNLLGTTTARAGITSSSLVWVGCCCTMCSLYCLMLLLAALAPQESPLPGSAAHLLQTATVSACKQGVFNIWYVFLSSATTNKTVYVQQPSNCTWHVVRSSERMLFNSAAARWYRP